MSQPTGQLETKRYNSAARQTGEFDFARRVDLCLLYLARGRVWCQESIDQLLYICIAWNYWPKNGPVVCVHGHQQFSPFLTTLQDLKPCSRMQEMIPLQVLQYLHVRYAQHKYLKVIVKAGQYFWMSPVPLDFVEVLKTL